MSIDECCIRANVILLNDVFLKPVMIFTLIYFNYRVRPPNVPKKAIHGTMTFFA